jgi:hypothetical protein
MKELFHKAAKLAPGQWACKACGSVRSTLTKEGICFRSCEYQKVRQFLGGLRKMASLDERGTHRGRTLVFRLVNGALQSEWALTPRVRARRKAMRRQQTASRRANRA